MNGTGILLFSGGLDSTVMLYWLLSIGWRLHLLSFGYSQKNFVAEKKAIEFIIQDAMIRSFTPDHPCDGIITSQFIHINTDFIRDSCSLTDPNQDVPRNRCNDEIIESFQYKTPSTYFPLRNAIFLSMAAAYATANNIEDIFIGLQSTGIGYPDCSPQFLSSISHSFSAGLPISGTRKNRQILIHAFEKTKRDIVAIGIKLDVPFEKTISCFTPIDNKACGTCDACCIRRRSFYQIGIEDRTIYAGK